MNASMPPWRELQNRAFPTGDMWHPSVANRPGQSTVTSCCKTLPLGCTETSCRPNWLKRSRLRSQHFQGEVGGAYFHFNRGRISLQTINVCGNNLNRWLKSRCIILFIFCILVNTTSLPPKWMRIIFGVACKPIHWILDRRSCHVIDPFPSHRIHQRWGSKYKLCRWAEAAHSSARETRESPTIHMSENWKETVNNNECS